MSSVRPAGLPFAAHTAQRIEVYCVLPGAGEQILTLQSATGHRVPGAVLGHGERPREAAMRAVAALGGADLEAGSDGSGLVLRAVLSHLIPPDVPSPGRPHLHVLTLVFQAGSLPPDLTIGEELLHSPVPASAGAPPAAGAPRVQRPAAYALVVRDERVLLSRVTGIGVWTLPGGGIDHGEHPDDAVRRETFEETGLRLASAQLADVDSRHFTGNSPDGVQENFHGVRILYRGEITDRSDPSVQEVDGTTDQAAWMRADQLAGLRLADIVRVALDRLM